MDRTPHLALPLVAANQAQKHVPVNEALIALDALVQLTVASRAATAPPASPQPGSRHIVPAGGVGAFAGRTEQIALFLDGAWRFLQPKTGWRAHVVDEARTLMFDGAIWRDETQRLDDLPRLGVNATADAAERLRVRSPSSLFDAEGGGHMLKINRASTAGGAAMFLQTAYQGRAEIGLAGDDALQVRVSADGAAWTSALRVEPTNGAVTAQGSRLGVTGSLGVGAAAGAPQYPLHVRRDQFLWEMAAIENRQTGAGALIRFLNAASPASGFDIGADAGGWSRFVVKHAGTNALEVSAANNVAFPQTATTASAANAFLDAGAGNRLMRSTSSRRYKTDIEPLEPAMADKVLQLQPVWYRSTAERDPAGWSWYGLVAEDVALVEPRLVHWASPADPDATPPGGPGAAADVSAPSANASRPDAAKLPDAVQYDRIAVLLLDVVKRLRADVDALKAAVPAEAPPRRPDA
jgi:hypothetical protein